MEIRFWDFLMLYKISFSPQVNQIVIISNKRGIYELYHELPNRNILRLQIYFPARKCRPTTQSNPGESPNAPPRPGPETPGGNHPAIQWPTRKIRTGHTSAPIAHPTLWSLRRNSRHTFRNHFIPTSPVMTQIQDPLSGLQNAPAKWTKSWHH